MLIIFTIFYREIIFQFQISLDFRIITHFYVQVVCIVLPAIVHKKFLHLIELLYKVLHYAIIKILMLYKKKKRTGCYYRGPGFSFQHPNGDPQPPVTLVPGDLMSSSDPPWVLGIK